MRRSESTEREMMEMQVSFLVVSLLTAATQTHQSESARIFNAYYPNWGQYRPAPYTYLPENVTSIAGRLDHLVYAYAGFDSHDFTIHFSYANDTSHVQRLMKIKYSHPQLKILLSIGGDSFASDRFGDLVSSEFKRSTFINNLQRFLAKHKFDGIDVNWMFPCSSSRIIHKKHHRLQCDDIIHEQDRGSNCPTDAENFVSLVKEMRSSLVNGTVITVTGPALPNYYKQLYLSSMSEYIDYWHVATYDYTVSTTNESQLTAPNAPLKSPPKASGVSLWSINTTISYYLRAGVPAEKIIIGIPLFGHTWYVPNLSSSNWKQFGLKGSIQGKCCGPFQQSYGAKYGRGSGQCGTYMYSEIIAAGVQYYYDRATQTAIGYVADNSSDRWTEKGTWFSFNDRNSIQAITQFIRATGLGGAFVFDMSQDTIDSSGREFTYKLMQTVFSGLHGGEDGSICNPAVGCNVCEECCRSYLTNQFDCDACVAIKCAKNVCFPTNRCNVCSTCCRPAYRRNSECNQCVEIVCD